MAKVKTKSASKASNDYRTPVTQEAEEAEMISLATKLARQQLIDGTASSQVITHYLKLGTTREKLEKEILEEQKKLYRAKTDQIESQKDLKALYENAVVALTRYQPTSSEVVEDDEY